MSGVSDDMTPKMTSSGTHRSASSEIIADDGNSTRHDIVNVLRDFENRMDAKFLAADADRNKPTWWKSPIAIIPFLMLLFGVVAERALDYGYIKDTLAIHEHRLQIMEESKLSKDQALEHWKSVDLQLQELRDADRRIEGEIHKSH